MKSRAWLLYLGGGIAALLGFLLLPHLRQGWVFNLISLSSPIAIVVAVRMWKPNARAPWYLFALGQTFFVIGDVITYNYNDFFGTDLPYPSIGDVAYLLVYPCLVGGLLLLIRRRNPGRDRDSVIDSLIVAIGVGTVQWVFLMSPVAHDSTSTLIQKLVGMAYPFMDLILLTAVVRLAMGAGRRAPSMYLMGAAALALFLTDTVYTYISVTGAVYDQSGYLEAGWGIFYLLWGAAALHPSMRTLSDKAPDVERGRMSKLRLLMLGGASLIAPGVMLIQLGRPNAVDMPVLIGASVMLFVLVVLRMAGLVRRQELSTLREKALRNAGAALVTATNRESIYTATLQAARALVGDDGGLRLLVANDDDGDLFQVVAAAGGAEGVEGTRVSLSILPQWKRDRLQSHRSYEVPTEEAELANSLGMPANATFFLNAPLFMKEELQGVLVVAGSSSVPRAIRDSIEALSSQVALALDSALTTEILLIRQSEARFSSLVQNSSDVVMVVEADSTIRYMSPSVEGGLGQAPGEL
jgi:PAS domain-containing protein